MPLALLNWRCRFSNPFSHLQSSFPRQLLYTYTSFRKRWNFVELLAYIEIHPQNYMVPSWDVAIWRLSSAPDYKVFRHWRTCANVYSTQVTMVYWLNLRPDEHSTFTWKSWSSARGLIKCSGGSIMATLGDKVGLDWIWLWCSHAERYLNKKRCIQHISYGADLEVFFAKAPKELPENAGAWLRENILWQS